MKKIIVTIMVLCFTQSFACDIHLTFTAEARHKLGTLSFGTFGDNSLYYKIVVVNNNWFRKSPLFSLFFTAEEWEDRYSFTLSCNSLQLFSRSHYFSKTQQGNDLESVTLHIDAEKFSSPDLKISLINNHDDFREKLPNEIVYKNIKTAKVFLTLDHNDEQGFYYQN